MKQTAHVMRGVLISACLTAAVFAQDATKVHTNDEIGFSIECPASWKEGAIKGDTIAASFMGDKINKSLQVIYNKGGEKEGMANLDKLGRLLKQTELSKEWKSVNGRRAFLQVAKWRNLLGETAAVRLMVPAGDHYFLVMGVCPGGEFETLRPLLEKCVLSFKITK